MKEVDYLVIGQGIAGTVFALQALERGKRVLVIDREEATTCSRVAAGIINPITGGRLAKSWRLDELWPAATAFYSTHGAECFQTLHLLRLLHEPEHVSQWKKRQTDPEYQALCEPGVPEMDPAKLQPHSNAFETNHAGWLNLPKFLDHAKGLLIEHDAFRSGNVAPTNIQARLTIWCQGYEAAKTGPFDWVPIRAGKGQILDLNIPDLDESRILNRRKWLLPIGQNRYRAGATFEWDARDREPTPEGRAELESALRQTIQLPFEVTSHQAAFRPMARQGRPILGRHPERPDQILFNGLGSKGVLLAPFFAKHLLDHLETGSTINPEVDVCRFWTS
ncbi:MAG: FAD-dependent oxidoreductase [Verrucomicrobiota bacterium]